MLVFDLETDGLLNDVTKIHCLVIYDSETDTYLHYNDEGNSEPIVRGIQRLEDADVIVGHNIISYDIPVIKKIYPWFNPEALIIDTFCCLGCTTWTWEIDKKRMSITCRLNCMDVTAWSHTDTS